MTLNTVSMETDLVTNYFLGVQCLRLLPTLEFCVLFFLSLAHNHWNCLAPINCNLRPPRLQSTPFAPKPRPCTKPCYAYTSYPAISPILCYSVSLCCSTVQLVVWKQNILHYTTKIYVPTSPSLSSPTSLPHPHLTYLYVIAIWSSIVALYNLWRESWTSCTTTNTLQLKWHNTQKKCAYI